MLRTPVKLVFVDLRRSRRLPRTEAAIRAAAVLATMLLALLATAALTGRPALFLPLLVALPLVLVEFAYDIRSRSRRLLPELLGTVGIGSVAPAIVLAAGGPISVASGLWFVVAARAVAAIPFVRGQLRRAKHQEAHTSTSDGAQVVAVLIAIVGAAVSEVPTAGVAAIAGLAVFHAIAARVPVPRVAVIGAQQVVLGLTVVLVTGLAVIAP